MPLKIAYVCYWNRFGSDGVMKKIDGQVDRWRRAGHEVEVFCVTRGDADAHPWRLFPFVSGPGRYRATQALQNAVLEYRPEVVYFRLDIFVPPLGRVMRQIPTVLEIQGGEQINFWDVRPRRFQFYGEFIRRVVFPRAAGVVYVTNELAAFRGYASFQKPTLVIGNGVDLEQLRELPPARNERPRLTFLGVPEPHGSHGLDKLLWLAEHAPELDFDVVGYAAEELPGTPPRNLRAHGLLPATEYEPILAATDVAIGTLAMHRIGMHENSPLKVREYLGYGLPVMIGYEDTDLMGFDPWFVLRLPNDELNVRSHLAEIRAFVERVRGKRVPRAEVADRIGWHAKEPARIGFMEQLVYGAAFATRTTTAGPAELRPEVSKAAQRSQ
jgi:hypothetical protein